MLCRYIDRYIVYELCYWKMFDPIILVVVDIAFEVLFNSLVESFYLSIGLRIKNCKKFVVYSEFCYEYYEEL